MVVAVFIAYNANNGLPFVPTYNLKVELPEASGLQKANQVRIAGTRVGVVGKLTAHEDKRTGRIAAIAELKLEKKVEPLPADTKAIVQSVSAIGLKYLELEKGHSVRTLKAGQTIPSSQTTEPVNIEDLFNMFDKPTRAAIKVNTINFGNGLAARGLGLNETIATLRPLVTNAVPVLHNLAEPQTEFSELWKALDHVASQSAPVAEEQANYYTDLDIFFTAFASVAPFIEEATVGGPPSLEQAIHSLPFQGPFTEKSTEFMRLLRPSAVILAEIAKPLGHAFHEGAINLKAATTLNKELTESSQALAEFGSNPVVKTGLQDFTTTLEIGNPLVSGIAPAQSVCNYITLAFRNLASLQSESVGSVGTLARAGFVLAPTGPNNEGFPSSGIANGPSEEHELKSTRIIDNNHVHANPYAFTAGPGQPQLCEAGNENYIVGKAITTNLPAAQVSKNREITSRSQNMFAETYPSSTLQALGISTTKGKGK